MIAAAATELEEPTLVDPRTVSVRFSALKRFSQSAAHYLYQVQRADDDDTLALRLGRGTHALLFSQPLAVWTGKVRSGKAWEAFEAEHADKVILNVREHDQARGVADAIMRHADASALLFDGTTIEQRVDWTIEGRACRGTPDAVRAEWIVDLKTTVCAAPDRFTRDAQFRAYHAQIAWYLDGLRAAGKPVPTDSYLVAVEKSPPFPVVVLELTERAVDMGRRLYRLWWEQLMNCERNGHYPGYAATTLPFDVDAPVDLDLEGLSDDEEAPFET